MKATNALVTGGAGFLGSHLADLLIKNGYNVSIIDDLSGGTIENINVNATFYECDLRDSEKTDELIKKIKPQLVYHLAANAAESKGQFSPIDISTRNFDTFINVLVPSVKYGMKRIVVTSSIAVYGAQQTPFKETDRPEPEDVYGISKYAMEQTLKVLADVHGFEYVITRPHNVYGPRQNMKDPYRNVVTIFMNKILQNKEYVIYGNGEQVRCFSYIDDVIDALYRCANSEVSGMTFNIGSDVQYSVNQLSDILCAITGAKIRPRYIPGRVHDVEIAISDHTESRKYLGYQDKTPLEQGLRESWKYAQSQGYQKPVFGGIELDSPLIPENWHNDE
jgi:UDP-glucose 4-epimerase